MGWISVGLLIISGGCILYKHPPNSVILLFSGHQISHKRASSPRPSPAGATSPDEDVKQSQFRAESSPSISAVTAEAERSDGSPPADPRSLAIPNVRLSPSAGTSHKPLSSPSDNAVKGPPKVRAPSLSTMPPPPRPSANSHLRPPPSAAASLRVPPTKTVSAAAFAPNRLKATPSKPSRQVTLTPGHSPLDWAALTSDPNNKLRGKDVSSDKLIRVPPSLLKSQNGRKGRDVWTVYQGKVYNITPYLPFHPGGEGELMRCAGRDAAKLFMEVHPWVNWEAMLGECLVGILVGEGEQQQSLKEGAGELDEMD